MTVCLENQLRSKTVRLGTIILFLLLSPPVSIRLQAGENANDASSMLEGLKQRSAAERWQRVKKQYPADSGAARRIAPSQLPGDHHESVKSDELPPAPTAGPLIPRLTAVPPDSSTDWVLSARVPSIESAEETNVQSPTPVVSSSQKQSPAAIEADKSIEQNPKTSLERTIEAIAPYYDRDRDSDIREYAMERIKDFDLGEKSKIYMARSFPEITLAWEASNYYHNPLYFNDPSLERYGHTYHPVVQPLASIARLGVQFVFLPYQMTINPPCREEYSLGWYRPGECTPKLCYQVPLNAQAALVEAAAVTGVYFFIIP